MKSDTYLKELQSRLLWHFSSEKTKEIVEDYNEMFEAGTAEGKDTTQLATSFGSPKEVVTELTKERGLATFFPGGIASFLPLQKGQAVLGAVSLVLMVFWLIFYQEVPHGLILPLIPLVCLRPFYSRKQLAIRDIRESKVVPISLICLTFLTAIALAAALIYFKVMVFDVINGNPLPFSDYYTVENGATRIGETLLLLMNLSIFFSLVLFSSTYVLTESKPLYYAFSLFSTSSFIFLTEFKTLLKGLDIAYEDAPKMITDLLLNILKNIGIAVLIALLVIIVRAILGREKKNG